MRPFLVLTLFVLFAAPAAAQTTPVDTTPTITADGLGTATLTPDVADFYAGVERSAPHEAPATPPTAAWPRCCAPSRRAASPTPTSAPSTSPSAASAPRSASA